MKLLIKSIEAKNFLSIGSIPFKYEYTPGLHAVTGKVIGQDTNNGAGKTTGLVDALVFGFFGKTLRSLTQDRIINSINKRDLVVKVCFNLNNKDYIIERGLAPNFIRLIDLSLDISERNEQSSKKLTQQDIDTKIGISFTSFINMIALNINYTESFFKIPISKKRLLLEDIMNLSVYADMFTSAKEDYLKFKTEYKLKEMSFKTLKTSYDENVNSYSKYTEMKQQFQNDKQLEINEIHNNINECKNKISLINIDNRDYSLNINEGQTKLEEVTNAKVSIEIDIKNLNKIIYEKNNKLSKLTKEPVCPYCLSNTDISHIEQHIDSENKEISLINDEITEKTKKLEIINAIIEKLKLSINKIRDKQEQVISDKQSLKDLETELFYLEKQLKAASDKEFAEEIITKEYILDVKKKLLNLNSLCKELKASMETAERMKDILGDEGIKNYTIKKILPILNKKMNKHLSNLKANYTISFDTALNETMKSRNRDEFVYENFSGGEKKRIDLAWLLTMFEIAKMRCSIDCNVLILDEALDSSLCAQGTQNLMNYFKTEFKKENPDLCIYVVSHKTEIKEDDFDSIIRIKKQNNFTKLDKIDIIDPVLQT